MKPFVLSSTQALSPAIRFVHPAQLCVAVLTYARRRKLNPPGLIWGLCPSACLLCLGKLLRCRSDKREEHRNVYAGALAILTPSWKQRNHNRRCTTSSKNYSPSSHRKVCATASLVSTLGNVVGGVLARS